LKAATTGVAARIRYSPAALENNGKFEIHAVAQSNVTGGMGHI
jgi:hypothetical protein